MKYRQLNAQERSVLAALRTLGLSRSEIARQMGRHRSTIYRELQRNGAPYDGWYRSARAHRRAHARRYRSRRNSQFTSAQWARVEELLREEWSPEQVAGYLRRHGELLISHETIYRHVWADWKKGGTLHAHLRGARKNCRKRYRHYDSRGRLAGKRMIGERPAEVERRKQIGHWEGMVEVFDVATPPPAVAYGWAVESDKGPQYITVKGEPPADSPLAAVRVWLVSEARKK